MRYIAILLLPAFFVTMLPAQSTSSSWKLKKSSDGVEVYYRQAENSPINEIKITTSFKGTLKSLLDIMRDVRGYPSWVYKCIESELVERVSPSEAIYYAVMDFPWPMSDRDFVAGSKIYTGANGKVVITVKGVADKVPVHKERVRVPVLDYRWEFIPLDDHNLQVKYYLRSDPGGELPAWLINLVIDQGPTQTVKNLRELLQRSNALGKGL